MKKFSRKKLKDEIMREAKVLNMHSGAAEMIADKVVEKVGKWADKRTEVTREDLNRMTAKALEEFDGDLAYVYKNRGKII
ncbi:hypothetical protein IJG66_00370 [Candidatus Saccharibacteria bacterium]|nr:hypothetical protein [Candidatus Saccharibacteria bacterium]